ncbi:ATPase [Hyaloscypha variabilis]
MLPGRLDILTALENSYIRRDQEGRSTLNTSWGAYLVPDKERAQIFLLHGPPGVGKTFTAECVAEYTKRPLMMLSSGDIGTDPVAVENTLKTHFRHAKSWDATLLIDEADVFLEKRATADLVRNNLVAEFYDGILCLTTNRIGAFDEAFISTVHLQLNCLDFDDEERQRIWQTFIDKLERERSNTMRIHISALEYISGEKIKELKLNSREIRNNTLLSLFYCEARASKDSEGIILLKDKHLKSVLDISRDFQEILGHSLQRKSGEESS